MFIARKVYIYDITNILYELVFIPTNAGIRRLLHDILRFLIFFIEQLFFIVNQMLSIWHWVGVIMSPNKLESHLQLYVIYMDPRLSSWFSCPIQLSMKFTRMLNSIDYSRTSFQTGSVFIMFINVKIPTIICWHCNIYEHEKFALSWVDHEKPLTYLIMSSTYLTGSPFASIRGGPYQDPQGTL